MSRQDKVNYHLLHSRLYTSIDVTNQSIKFFLYLFYLFVRWRNVCPIKQLRKISPSLLYFGIQFQILLQDFTFILLHVISLVLIPLSNLCNPFIYSFIHYRNLQKYIYNGPGTRTVVCYVLSFLNLLKFQQNTISISSSKLYKMLDDAGRAKGIGPRTIFGNFLQG